VPFGQGAAGAAWVFTRSGGSWTQQGEKLVSSGNAQQGMAVALSADGDVALVGGRADGGVGAALVFARSGGSWTNVNKLITAGAVGNSAPSVALSADGNVVMVGGANDNGGIGAAWVFTRVDAHWTQVQKLVGTGVGSEGNSGPSMAMPADGSVVLVGGSTNSGGRSGPVVTRSGNSFNQDPPSRIPFS
jgi:hypothetical protein